MKKQTLSILTLVLSQLALAQVGINNTDPQATLDITAKTTNGSKPEGIIAPRLTGDQIASADSVYTSAQIGTIIYATSAVTSPLTGSKTENITVAGYYFYDGSKWQKLSGSGSGTGMTYSGSTSIGLNGNSFERAALTGDASAAVNSNAITVTGLQGRSLSSTPPSNGQVLKYNASTNKWEPSAESGSGSSYSAGTGLSLSGTTFSATDATTTAKGIVQLSGDLSGTSTSPTVAKLQGRTVSTTVPTNGQVLKYNTTTSAWEPAADANASYSGSTTVALNGTSFERAALTGDVTAS
ncbi:MAG: hypothetical protein E2590_03690, partial [Chryseobacterium sp.]|nr:hypothetical protein [Chryseobacterium sp.]